MPEIVEVLVEGGKASAGPPIGPALGPHGVNIVEIVNKINEVTADFQGTTVPVKITIDPVSKKYSIEVGTPPASALILKRAGKEKGSPEPRERKVGTISMQDVIDIAAMKKDSLQGKSPKARAKEVVGTCVSMGIKVDNKNPRDVQREIDEGIYDDLLQPA
ncbi:MAG: 50S ribosomal protein L11 [Candidatus Thermoplasmatota archaeon]|nr:50S ribosomal protein L11 [Candidatus Thermoplasmatota archaeon]